MKTPTTPFSIDIQENWKITREFLESEGWRLTDEKPLFESFVHTKNTDLVCSIGLYGSFYVAELHWMNKTPERVFQSMNPFLTIDDYHKIISLLNIKTPWRKNR